MHIEILLSSLTLKICESIFAEMHHNIFNLMKSYVVNIQEMCGFCLKYWNNDIMGKVHLGKDPEKQSSLKLGGDSRMVTKSLTDLCTS